MAHRSVVCGPWLLAPIAALALACATPEERGRGEAPDEASAADPGRLSFDWKTGCRVPVRERLKEGKSQLEISFVLRVAPSKEDASVEVHFADVRVLSTDGVPVPEADQGPVGAAVATPTVVASNDGTKARLLDLDAHLSSPAAI